MNTEIPLGDIEFTNISINHKRIATALEKFVQQGSQHGAISVTDLTIIRREGRDNVPFTTLSEALHAGTRLFDALCYFSLPLNSRPMVTVVELPEDSEDPDISTISRSVFYIFMWILIRGQAPHLESRLNNQPVPKFLSDIMGLRAPPSEYVANVASFDLAKMDVGWVEYIRLDGIDRKAQNRLALGVAGYRLPTALTLLRPKEDAHEDVKRAFSAVRSFISAGMVWDVFNGTRSQRFLERVRNFNGNISNLMLSIANREDIQKLVDKKILFTMPQFDDRFQEYLTWDDNTFRDFNNFIFPKNG